MPELTSVARTLTFLTVLTGCLAHLPHDVVESLAVTADGATVFARSRRQVLRSTDGGRSWTWSNRGFGWQGGRTFLEASPAFESDGTVFYGGPKSGPLHRSEDEGSHWTAAGGDAFRRPCSFAFAPGYGGGGGGDGVLFVAGEIAPGGEGERRRSYGLFLSPDRGETFVAQDLPPRFSESLAGGDGCPTALLATARAVLVGSPGGGRLVGSVDGGLTWDSVKLSGARIPWGHGIRRIVAADAGGARFVLLTKKGGLYLASEIAGGDVLSFSLTQIGVPPNSVGRPSPVISIDSHEGPGGEVTLFVLRKNDVLVTSDPEGGRWAELGRDDGLLFYQLSNPDNATKFNKNEFNIVRGVPRTNTVFMGTFGGVYRSDNGGRKWEYLPTINQHITGIDVVPAGNGNSHEVSLALCTYAAGCMAGSVDLGALASSPSARISAEAMQRIAHLRRGRFNQVVLSPSFSKDGLMFRVVKGVPFIDRSDDNFKTSKAVYPPKINPSQKGGIQVLVASPNFASDGTLYAVGRNIGISVSTNRGRSFRTLRGFGGRDVLQLSLSPTFSTDGTMAVTVDGDPNGNKYIYQIYFSQDRGETWTKTRGKPKPWANIAVISGEEKGFPIIVGLQKNGRLYILRNIMSNLVWRLLDKAKNIFLLSEEESELGFGFYGLAVGPNGELAAAFKQGGLVLGRVHNQELKDMQVLRMNEVEPTTFAWNFNAGTPVIWRLQELIAFSPFYGRDDRIIFGGSFNSLYASFNGGKSWRDIFTVSQD